MSETRPQGWTIVPLGELTKPSRPRRVPTEHKHLRFVGMEQVESHTRRLLGTLPASEMKSTAFHFQPGDVLYGRLRPYLNKVLCADFEGLCSSEFIVLPPQPYFDPKYLGFYLTTDDFVSFANHINQGDRPRVNFDQIAEHEIPLPPLAEQRRIVAKLERLLGKADACKERLAKIPILLKRFRQAVLAAACSGKLTADWREEVGTDGEWPKEPLAELFTMRNGKSLTVGSRQDGQIPVYGGNGRMGTHKAANAEGQVIVIGRVGAQCGNVHFINGKVWVTDNAISLEAKRKVEPAFYAFFLRSQNLNQLSAGTGQPYVSQEILGPIEAPVVSLPEQSEIVRRVDALFAVADHIQSRFERAREQVESLTPALLARAFRGELVPHDPNDEPASALLARIRAK